MHPEIRRGIWSGLQPLSALGARRAVTMVLGEVAERTWDATRGAALSPLSMALGKFAGVVLPSWSLLLPALACLAWLSGSAEGALLALRILSGQAFAAAAGLAFARLLDGQASVDTGGAQLAGIAAVAWGPCATPGSSGRWPPDAPRPKASRSARPRSASSTGPSPRCW